MDEAPALVQLTRVTKVYGSGEAAVVALGGVDLRIDDGEFIAIMGPSGSGKSTCMNIIGCLDTPTSGSYRFRGVEVTRLTRNQRALLRRHYLGFVFQGYNLLARTTALENVEIPLIYRRQPLATRRPRAYAAMSGSWVTIAMVIPLSSFNRTSSSRISRLSFESRLPVGSSARSRAGSVTIARAIATRCC
jgi:predicted ABC-type transport system involved in lysophospholipase L1 biosynthesis ATPase subunit